DTDVVGKHTGYDMGKALKERMERGFTFLKMDLGINHLIGTEGALSAPLGFLEEFKKAQEAVKKAAENKEEDPLTWYNARNRLYDLINIAHPFTGIHITEKGLDILEEYVAQVREVIGYDIPL